MPSLDDHFRALTAVRPPAEWPDLQARDTHPPPSTPPLRRRAAIVALALVLAAAGFAFAVTAFHTRSRAPMPSSAVENGVIAFSRGGPHGGLYIVNPDGSGETRLTSDQGDTDPAWSPDGSRIAFVRGFADEIAGIYVMNADGSAPRRITSGVEDTRPAWCPDGARIAFAGLIPADGDHVGNQDIYVVNVDGTGLVRLTDDPLMESSPAWSPDGSRIAFVGYDLAADGNPPSSVRLYVMNADGSDIHTLGPENVDEPAWSPEGSEIAFVDTEAASVMTIHPDGRGERRILDLADRIGGVHLVSGATWSPDGTKLAFMAGPDSEHTHIYVVNQDGSGFTQLTDGPAPDWGPAWQPVPAADASPTSEPTPSPTETNAPTVDPNPSAHLQIQPRPGSVSSVIFGFGDVWVSRYDGQDFLARIDPVTNQLEATVALDGGPIFETGGGGMAVGHGSLWVVGSTRSGAILQRIDPETNTVVATISLGEGDGTDVAVDETGVWAVASDLYEGGASSIVRVDPATNTVVSRVPLQYGYVSRVLVIDGTVVVRQLHWHGELGEESGPYSIFTSIDAQTGAVLANTTEDTYSLMFAWNGQLWAKTGAFSAEYLIQVDPITLTAIGDQVLLEAQRFGPFRWADDGVWFVSAEGVNHWQQPVKVNRFNPATGGIDVSAEVPKAGGIDMAVGGGAIWFLTYEGDLNRFDLN